MKLLILIFSFGFILTSCSKTSSYSSVCNQEAKVKGGDVSGKKIAVTRVNRNTYRTIARRPHRLGLLRR